MMCTSGVKVAERLLGTRVCLLLVSVFVCSIDWSTSSGVSTRAVTDATSFRHHGNLTNEQRNSVVTTEINFRCIDLKNRTVLKAVSRKILQHINCVKLNTAPPACTTISASITITAVATTPITSTTTTTTTTTTTSTTTTQAVTTTPIISTASRTRPLTPRPERRKRSPTSGADNITFSDEDLSSVEIQEEFDENGNLRMTFLLDPQGVSTRAATDATSFRHHGNLTNEQRNSVVTTEINFRCIDLKNQTALKAVSRKILQHINRVKLNTVPPACTTISASITITAVATTPPTSTTTTTTSTTTTTQAVTTTPITSMMSRRAHEPDVEKRKRRKRSATSGEKNITFTDEDLSSIEIQEEFDENGNLRMTFLLDPQGSESVDQDQNLLYDIEKAFNGIDEFEATAVTPVANIYRRLPMPETPHLDLNFLISILVAINVLLVIFIFVCYWKARNKKMAEKTAGIYWSEKDQTLC